MTLCIYKNTHKLRLYTITGNYLKCIEYNKITRVSYGYNMLVNIYVFTM